MPRLPSRNSQDQAGEASPLLLERESRALLHPLSRVVRSPVYRLDCNPCALCAIAASLLSPRRRSLLSYVILRKEDPYFLSLRVLYGSPPSLHFVEDDFLTVVYQYSFTHVKESLRIREILRAF